MKHAFCAGTVLERSSFDQAEFLWENTTDEDFAEGIGRGPEGF
jgi:hypothetical protein